MRHFLGALLLPNGDNSFGLLYSSSSSKWLLAICASLQVMGSGGNFLHTYLCSLFRSGNLFLKPPYAVLVKKVHLYYYNAQYCLDKSWKRSVSTVEGKLAKLNLQIVEMVFGRIGRLVDSHPSLGAIGFVALTFFKKIFSQVFTVFFFLYNFIAGFHLICSSHLRLMQRFNINSSLFIVIHFIL